MAATMEAAMATARTITVAAIVPTTMAITVATTMATNSAATMARTIAETMAPAITVQWQQRVFLFSGSLDEPTETKPGRKLLDLLMALNARSH